ncbi:MAG: hypothetical protein RR336_10995, partial [Oscillospiraceae bacterium]
RVGTSQLFPVALSDVTVSSVPTSKITHVSTNFKGEVDLIVLDNVTGDHYTYGLPIAGTMSGGSGDMSYTNQTVSITNGGKGLAALVTGTDFSNLKNTPIGITAALQKLDGTPKMADWVKLTKSENVRRSSFSDDSVMVGSQRFPLDPNIDVQCYNSTTKSWFASLDAAKAYATTFTVYYDRPASEGGKIRVVIAE